MTANATTTALQHDLNWLSSVIEYAIKSYLEHEGYDDTWLTISYTPYADVDSSYARRMADLELNDFERLALLLALAPYVKPELLDIFLAKNSLYDRSFTEFGGRTGTNIPGFQPTGQTFSFLLGTSKTDWLSGFFQTLGNDAKLIEKKIIVFDNGDSSGTIMHAPMLIAPDWLHKMLTGSDVYPMQPSFPAHKITTNLSWEDVVFNGNLLDEIDELKNWIKHESTLMADWGLARKIKPGYKSLFYGPPGTGKTLTATLLGAESGLDVYKVDLSLISSKYIGETEKNIAAIFDLAAQKNWLLFFDEAESLFGKRTENTSSNDRYANQQVGYLLQRVEDHPGVVILASNLKSNIDEAFARRFQSMIYFPLPTADERLMLWRNAFSGKCRLSPDIDLHDIAAKYELTGGSIVNILRTCAIAAVANDNDVVDNAMLRRAILKEFRKSNRNILPA